MILTVDPKNSNCLCNSSEQSHESSTVVVHQLKNVLSSLPINNIGTIIRKYILTLKFKMLSFIVSTRKVGIVL